MSTPAGSAPFTAETFQNEYLGAGADTVDAVVTVTAAGDPQASTATTTSSTERAEIIVIDTSGSMASGRKMPAVRDAAAAAVETLEDGVQFAVVEGANQARMVWPLTSMMVAATPETRQAAVAAVRQLDAEGGTAIGAWLLAVRGLFETSATKVRHAILLTDGRNETQTPAELAAAIEVCRGHFQCDCRGVGVDWDVEELRGIASALLGTVDIVADPEDLAEDFRAMITSSQSRALPDVRLRLWTPQGAVIESVRQVAPEVLDMSAGAEASSPQINDYLLGGWAPGESRDYHLRIKVQPGAVGDEMLAGRISLVLGDGAVATQALVRAVWTNDPELPTQMNKHVAHYTGQVELADAIQSGLAAAKNGDTAGATLKLGKAVKLATESGHSDTLKLLAKVVDVTDAASGTVKLKPAAGKADEMTLDTRSTRTVRLGKPANPGQGA